MSHPVGFIGKAKLVPGGVCSNRFVNSCDKSSNGGYLKSRTNPTDIITRRHNAAPRITRDEPLAQYARDHANARLSGNQYRAPPHTASILHAAPPGAGKVSGLISAATNNTQE